MHRFNVANWFILLCISAGLSGQWRGPGRDGAFPSSGLLNEWPDGGPELVFKVSEIGEGFSSPVVHQGTIYVTGKVDSMDVLSALTLSGKIIWQVPYGYSWQKSYTPTRSSPTMEGNRAYLLSGLGELVCLNIETRAVIWSREVDKTFGAVWDAHGVSETLLVVDDLVVCSPAGKQTSMVAFNKYTGEQVWQTLPVGGNRSYVSPVLYEHQGIRQILGATTWTYYSVDPATGKIIWTFPYHVLGDRNTDRGTLVTFTPMYSGREIFITSGYNYPAIMLTLSEDGHSVSEKWRSPAFDTHHGHVVRVEDFIYGSNWISNSQGEWMCVDWNSGEVRWTKKWNTKGSIICADGMIYIYEERQGHVGLLKPDSDRFNLISSFRVLEGTGPHWSHPVIHEDQLMIRHGDHLMVYDIKR